MEALTAPFWLEKALSPPWPDETLSTPVWSHNWSCLEQEVEPEASWDPFPPEQCCDSWFCGLKLMNNVI